MVFFHHHSRLPPSPDASLEVTDSTQTLLAPFHPYISSPSPLFTLTSLTSTLFSIRLEHGQSSCQPAPHSDPKFTPFLSCMELPGQHGVVAQVPVLKLEAPKICSPGQGRVPLMQITYLCSKQPPPTPLENKFLSEEID